MTALNKNATDPVEPISIAPSDSTPAFDRCYSLAQTAEILGVSVPTAWRLLKAKRIAHQYVSARRITIRESAIRNYLDEVTVQSGVPLDELSSKLDVGGRLTTDREVG
jgi:predicted DNA-binding transcriptional regulator AlpA